MLTPGAPAPSGDAPRAERRLVVRATTLTPAEAARVEAQAEAAGLAVADYLRARLLDDPVAASPPAGGEGVTLPAREAAELLALLRDVARGEGASPDPARAAALAEALERALQAVHAARPAVSAPSSTR